MAMEQGCWVYQLPQGKASFSGKLGNTKEISGVFCRGGDFLFEVSLFVFVLRKKEKMKLKLSP